MEKFIQYLRQTFAEVKSKLPNDKQSKVSTLREKALNLIISEGLPNYTDMFTMLNGWYVHKNAPLTTFPNGVIVGSIMAAVEQYPELVLSHLTKFYSDKADKFVRLNELLFNDGFFVYVPDEVSVEKPMQFVSIVNSPQKLMINNHNLVILGRNASLSLVQCDDSLQQDQSFTNNVSEMILEEGSHLHFYKMENKDAQTMELNHVFVHQKGHSTFFSNAITFNAGILRNMIHVDLAEPFADAKLYGLYLVDKKQFVDNQVYVNHIVPDCTSYQLYKGIADDESHANFNGHIVVRPQAQRTSAYQTNKNIVSNESYLKSRGICERNARALLMYAFANEVVNFVEIDSLRERLLDMTQRRLSGELSACSHCAFPCGEEKSFSFKIDLSKI